MTFDDQMAGDQPHTEVNLPVQHIDKAALMITARQMVDAAKGIVIDSALMYDVARDELTALKTQRAAIEEGRLERTRPLDEKKKELMDEVREPLALYDEAIASVTVAAAAYAQRVEAERREAERVQRERERTERQERERLVREEEARAAVARAEQARLDREADEASERARIAAVEAERAAMAGDIEAADRAKLEERAEREKVEQAEKQSREQSQQASQSTRMAQETLAAPPTVYTAPVAAAKGTRKSWKAECTDKALLLKHVAAHPELTNLFELNQTGLNQLAKAQCELLNLPGVRVYEDLGVTAKRR